VTIIDIIWEARAWCSVSIVTGNGCWAGIVCGFGCNENNCAGMKKNQHRGRPLLMPPPQPPQEKNI